jgi:hypothetical protein
VFINAIRFGWHFFVSGFWFLVSGLSLIPIAIGIEVCHAELVSATVSIEADRNKEILRDPVNRWLEKRFCNKLA